MNSLDNIKYKSIKNIEEFKSDSSSGANFYTGKINIIQDDWDGSVFIKSTKENTENLVYERSVYKTLFDKNKIHPEIDSMFILPVGIFEKDNKAILVTKKYNNMIALFDYIYENRLTIDNMYNIVLEVFNATYYMNTILKIQHNDLHFGNILIKKHSPRKKKYFFNNKQSFMKDYMSEYTVRIYDFDQAYMENKENTYLDSNLCYDYGSCNQFSTKDLFIIAGQFIIYNGINPEFKDIIRNTIDIDLFNAISQLKDDHWSRFCKMETTNLKSFISKMGCTDRTLHSSLGQMIDNFLIYMQSKYIVIKNKYLKYKNKYLKLKYSFS
jgi:hypothetical protein